MRVATALAIVSLLAGGAAIAAEHGVSPQSPGHIMQDNGLHSGTHGASDYAPGQEMQRNAPDEGTNGASGYAPGHSSSGFGADNDSNTGTQHDSK